MSKIHLRRAANPENRTTACATNPFRTEIRRNGRTTYQFMASEVVSFADFAKVPADNRCSHCCDAALVIRNRQRKAKGKPPVAVWNENL